MHRRSLSGEKNLGLTSAIPAVPVTVDRPVYTDWSKVKHPSIARAINAVTERSPDGTTANNYNAKHSQRTVLQQHCDFFDLNGDGVLTPWETFVGFRLLEWNILLALVAVLIIHIPFSYVTLPPRRFFPDPLFRIYLAHANNAKHGSDTGAYDHEGRFRPQQLADFFSKHGVQLMDGDYGMTYKQMLRAVWRQRCVADLFGISAGFFEWSATYFTVWPEDGILRMEDARAVYDGSYFYKVAGPKRDQYTSGKAKYA